MECEQITFRKLVPSDLPFLFKSWLTSYKHSSKFAKRIPDSVFYSNHHTIIEHILESAHVVIAHLPEEANVIVGFLVVDFAQYGKPTIHYVYVKEAFRRMGVMSLMIDSANIDMTRAQFTHWTECYCRECLDRIELSRSQEEFQETHWIKIKWPKLIYNPYAI